MYDYGYLSHVLSDEKASESAPVSKSGNWAKFKEGAEALGNISVDLQRQAQDELYECPKWQDWLMGEATIGMIRPSDLAELKSVAGSDRGACSEKLKLRWMGLLATIEDEDRKGKETYGSYPK